MPQWFKILSSLLPALFDLIEQIYAEFFAHNPPPPPNKTVDQILHPQKREDNTHGEIS